MMESALHTILCAGYQRKSLFPIPLLPIETCQIDLSLVIPVYNAEQHISKCLDSILGQETRYKYEVVCIDDGSQDGSLEVLHQYAKRYENLRIYSQPNGGISAARNAGIEHARGLYIGFIDNDDYVANGYVEKMLNAAYMHHADIVQVGYDRVNSKGDVLWSYRKGDFVAERKEYDALYDSLRGTIWGGCFHRNIFQDIRFPVGFWYEDMINKLVLLRLSNRLVSIDECLYYWVARSDSAMSTYWKSYDIQALDQVWLPELLTDYAEHNLGLAFDHFLQKTYVHEYSYMLYLRTHKLPRAIRKAAFTLASNNLRQRGLFSEDYYCPIRYRNFVSWDIVCFVKFIYTEFGKRLRYLRSHT